MQSIFTSNFNIPVLYGMQKRDGSYVQYKPILSLTGSKLPTVELGDHFTYLGRLFDYEGKDNVAKANLEKKLHDMLLVTDSIQTSTQNKLKILSRYILSHISFELKIYNFASTWIDNTLDALCYRFIRRWMQLPISACLIELHTLERKKGGLGLPSIKSLAGKLKITSRHTLRHSADPNIRKMWRDSSPKYVTTDETLLKNASLSQAKNSFKNSLMAEAWSHLSALNTQGASIKMINFVIETKNINLWAKTIENLPELLFNFAHKALLQTLPTLANLARWKLSVDSSCKLCNHNCPQTNKHVLANCSSIIALNRYTSRHNEILYILYSWLRSVVNKNQHIFVDLAVENSTESANIFQRLRPDLLVYDLNSVCAYELTICHETNLQKSKEYKREKYRSLSEDLTPAFRLKPVLYFSLEVSVLGFISSSLDFTKACNLPPMPVNVSQSIIRTVMSQSYKIYCNRNNP